MNSLKINPDTHLLESVSHRLTPHCDERPQDMDIDLIVIHGISLPPGEFGSPNIEQFFCGELAMDSHPYFKTIAHLRVSSHVLIKRDGVIVQFVPFNKRAWHAGASSFQGRLACNDFSIGIELEGTDELAYETIQYEQLARIIKSLMQTYPTIKANHVLGHEHIAPGRKTDPGPAFNWEYLKGKLI
jgi:AmpD protein